SGGAARGGDLFVFRPAVVARPRGGRGPGRSGGGRGGGEWGEGKKKRGGGGGSGGPARERAKNWRGKKLARGGGHRQLVKSGGGACPHAAGDKPSRFGAV